MRTLLRVEQMVPALPAAGMEVVVARLTRALTLRGYDVGITCIEYVGALGERLREEGIDVTLVPTPGMASILYPRALADWLRRRDPDVLHIHSGAWLKGARAAALAGVPRVIHTVHGLLDREPWHGPLWKRLAARYTGAITAVSQPLLEYLQEVVHLSPDRLHLVPNGVDTQTFVPGKPSGRLRRALGIGADRFVIGHVARFSPVKNHRMLLDAFDRVHTQHPTAYLALIGDGPLRPAVEEQVRDLDLQGSVGFYGVAEDLPSLYRDLDAFALSSLAEGTSMSMLEAMASGLSVAATSVGGNLDLLDHGTAGLLTPSEDAPALAEALGRIIQDETLRRRLGQAARQRVIDHYSESEAVSRFERLYHGTCDGVPAKSLPESTCVE